mmetsp:Transcript_60892/g.181287  ORF Transcript_60892/g.181287 Transcript_60892/m.181287 type:complete len:224 (-) Transcript_60892:850-1521(-)
MGLSCDLDDGIRWRTAAASSDLGGRQRFQILRSERHRRLRRHRQVARFPILARGAEAARAGAVDHADDHADDCLAVDLLGHAPGGKRRAALLHRSSVGERRLQLRHLLLRERRLLRRLGLRLGRDLGRLLHRLGIGRRLLGSPPLRLPEFLDLRFRLGDDALPRLLVRALLLLLPRRLAFGLRLHQLAVPDGRARQHQCRRLARLRLAPRLGLRPRLGLGPML